ncbi:MAG: hypothetical protein JNG90_18340 [Planctomycetaceae bacterium]|nr:hypothetical protein [Planctomycetaceae bacterium]
MDFDKRLEQAIARGHRVNAARQEAAAERALSAEEQKRLHSQYRLELSEHIEHALEALPRHLPGFRYETLVTTAGWGAKLSRDDWKPRTGESPSSVYSRLEVTVRPLGSFPVLEIAAKGTIRNKEVFQRQQHQQLAQIDLPALKQAIDNWVLEYAELYSTGG